MKWKVKQTLPGEIIRCGNTIVTKHFAYLPKVIGVYNVWLSSYYYVHRVQTKERTIILPMTHKTLTAIMPGVDVILKTTDFSEAENKMISMR